MTLTLSIALLLFSALLTWLLRNVLPTSALRGWLLALFPATSFGLVLSRTVGIDSVPEIHAYPWISALNLNVTLYFDALSALFALLVTGIGTLIIIYAGYYFKGDRAANRFLAYLFLFMSMMLGLILAGDVLTLFMFWEGTSITSFLLVAYKYQYESARRGAFRALFITGGGGIALLAGLLFTSHIAGGSDYATILASNSVLVQSELYLVALGLVAFGAFTKSAQFPAHIWLPGAMSAPTPASAYLHSATMVKAGIYLMARLNPALGGTDVWFWLLSGFGLTTMVVGAYLGTKQNDLKALLAYSTISQLGILMMLIGQQSEIAAKALVVGIVAHAFYKSALFMLAGTIDHEAGTRELSRLGGLRKAMPITMGLMTIAAISLAGLPPLFGFLGKETLLASAVDASLSPATMALFATAIVAAAAFKVVQAGMITVDVFSGTPRDDSVKAHEAPLGMLFAPAVPAALGLVLGLMGLFPDWKPLTSFLGYVAQASHAEKVKVSLAMWTGFNLPLLLSAIAIAGGGVLFWQRNRLIAWQHSLPEFTFERVHVGTLRSIDTLAFYATRIQTGQLRLYLSVILISMLGLVLFFGGVALPLGQPSGLGLDLITEFNLLRIFALVATVGAAFSTILFKRDFFAILALSAAGLGVAVYMAVEPAPDVTLVQIVVDILATVILVLALSRLPRAERRKAVRVEGLDQVRNIAIAFGSGLLVALISATALLSRSLEPARESRVTPFYEENSKLLTGASDIVGAIIVDFRALDTLIEIAVFGLAGLGVYTLLRHAARKHGDDGAAVRAVNLVSAETSNNTSFGIGGMPTSTYVQAMANILLPVAFMIAVIHMLYGHDRPGDGFTAGVIASLAVGFRYVVFGFHATRKRYAWLKSHRLIALGILLVIASGMGGYFLEGAFLASVDYGKPIGLPLPKGVKFSSGFVFEVAIALSVLGSVTYMLDTLGRPAIDSEALIEPQNAVESVEASHAVAYPASTD